MRFKETIDLATYTTSLSVYGDVIKTPTYRTVFANKKSIRQGEFYQANAQGLKPEIMFIMRLLDYEDEKLLRFEGVDYKIIRVYERSDDYVELICQGVVNDG